MTCSLPIIYMNETTYLSHGCIKLVKLIRTNSKVCSRVVRHDLRWHRIIHWLIFANRSPLIRSSLFMSARQKGFFWKTFGRCDPATPTRDENWCESHLKCMTPGSRVRGRALFATIAGYGLTECLPLAWNLSMATSCLRVMDKGSARCVKTMHYYLPPDKYYSDKFGRSWKLNGFCFPILTQTPEKLNWCFSACFVVSWQLVHSAM